MFNTPLKFSNIVNQHKHFLGIEFEVFRHMTTSGKIVNKDETFVHIKDLCKSNKLRYHMSKRFDVLPGCFKGIYNLHKRGYRILEIGRAHV